MTASASLCSASSSTLYAVTPRASAARVSRGVSMERIVGTDEMGSRARKKNGGTDATVSPTKEEKHKRFGCVCRTQTSGHCKRHAPRAPSDVGTTTTAARARTKGTPGARLSYFYARAPGAKGQRETTKPTDQQPPDPFFDHAGSERWGSNLERKRVQRE